MAGKNIRLPDRNCPSAGRGMNLAAAHPVYLAAGNKMAAVILLFSIIQEFASVLVQKPDRNMDRQIKSLKQFFQTASFHYRINIRFHKISVRSPVGRSGISCSSSALYQLPAAASGSIAKNYNNPSGFCNNFTTAAVILQAGTCFQKSDQRL